LRERSQFLESSLIFHERSQFRANKANFARTKPISGYWPDKIGANEANLKSADPENRANEANFGVALTG
jgi:hypothetical protein